MTNKCQVSQSVIWPSLRFSGIFLYCARWSLEAGLGQDACGPRSSAEAENEKNNRNQHFANENGCRWVYISPENCFPVVQFFEITILKPTGTC